MPTISATWNAGTGNWFVAGNWDEPNPSPPPAVLHAVPGADNDVSIPDNTNMGVAFTVTYNGTSTINTLTGSAVATLDITGGSLTVLNGGNGFGTIDVAAGATLSVGDGVLSLNNGSFTGNLSGNGTLRFVNGDFEINSGVDVTIANWLLTYQVGSATVSTTDINTDLSYAGNFQLLDVFGNFPILNLNHHTLTLSNIATIDGNVENGGTIDVTGSASVLNAGFHDGARLEIAGTATQSGTLDLDGTLQIDVGASYTLSNASQVVIASGGAATTTNDGTLGVTGGGVSRLNGTFTNNGTLSVDSGAELSLQTGTATLNGIVTGAGRLTFGFAHDVVINTTALDVAAILVAGGNGGGTVTLAEDIGYAGAFTLSDTGVFDLNGHSLTLSGTATFTSGNVDGAGTLKITGTATMAGMALGYGAGSVTGADNAIAFENSGTVTQNGSISVNGTILNDASHSYEITVASNITGAGALGLTFTNNGTLADSAAGTSTISGDFTNAAGATISIGTDAILNLDAGDQLLDGVITGAGQLRLGFAHNVTLETSTLSVGSILINGGNGGGTVTLGKSLSYANTFTFQDQFGTLDLNGFNLTLSGMSALTGGAIDGDGTLDITGTSTIGSIAIGDKQGGGGSAATFQNSGSVTQTGFVFVNGTIINDASHSYEINAASNITGTGTDGLTFTNNGTLTDSGAGTSTISGDFSNAAGATMDIAADAILNLDSGDQVLDGTISGAGQLRFGFAHNVTLETGTLSVDSILINGGNGGGTLSLGKSLSYANTFTFQDQFGTLDLNGFNLALSGESALSGGAIDGDGTLEIAGTSTIGSIAIGDKQGGGGSAATFENSGAVTQTAGISVNGTILNDAGHTYTLQIGNIDGANGAIVNNGTFDHSGDAGSSAISTLFTNSGLVVVHDGTLVVQQMDNGGVIQGVIAVNGAQYTITPDEAGHVTLTGGSGNNTLDGRNGISSMAGGSGNDTYLIDGLDDTITEATAKSQGKADVIKTSISYELAAGLGIEKLIAASGKSAVDLTGNAAKQTIIGNGGANSIDGGSGADMLTGKAGKDMFVFADAPGSGVDRITDMHHNVDVIALSLADFTKVGKIGHDLADAAFWASESGKAHDASDRIIYDTDSGKLYYDADGNKHGGVAAIQFAILDPHLKLDNGDFHIIA